MGWTPPAKPEGPWYKHPQYWKDLVNAFMAAYVSIPRSSRIHAEIESYTRLAQVRLIFESNLLEGAGLSRGETTKIITENFPSIPSDYRAFRHAAQHKDPISITDAEWDRMVNVIAEQDRIGRNLRPSVTLGRKSRGVIEVLQHRLAMQKTETMVSKFLVWDAIHRSILDNRPIPEEVSTMFASEIEGLRKAPPALWSEEAIKDLHKTLAEDLLPPDAGVCAGEYRVDERTVDFDVAFPSPELVPDSMRTYVDQTNKWITSPSGDIHPIDVASKVSYGLVRIHPFPDFNGRISRLLLMMVLRVKGVPFPVSLLGNSRGRHRYLTSLRRANRGDLTPYSALIAMRLVEQFQELDENIQLAGLGSLLDHLPPRDQKKLS